MGEVSRPGESDPSRRSAGCEEDSSAGSAPGSSLSHRFDPVDLAQMRLLARLTPGQRLAVMLDAQEFARGIIWGRVRQLFPHASQRELGLKVLEEIERAKRAMS